MLKLFGRACPFDEVSVVPVRDGGRQYTSSLYEVIERGAFGPEALDASLCHLNIDHDRASQMPGAGVRLYNTRAGVYAYVNIPEREARPLRASARRWRGFSIAFDATTVTSAINIDASRRHVRRIGCVTGVGLCVDRAPAYAGTWVQEFGPAALARFRADLREKRIAAFGRADVPRAWDPIPRQADAVEERLISMDPDRAYALRFGEI